MVTAEKVFAGARGSVARNPCLLVSLDILTLQAVEEHCE